jgi:hypothetical protein
VHLKPGSRCRSQVGSTEIIVIRCDVDDVALTCGGQPMVELDAPSTASQLKVVPGFDGASSLGKRYEDGAGQLEVLVTRGGLHLLGIGRTPLIIKDAKPLPSSD